MSVRELQHPTFEIEDHDEGLLVTFRVPGSTLGPVSVVLSDDEADTLADALCMALTFLENPS